MSAHLPLVATMDTTIGELLADAEIFVDGDWVESKDQDPNGDVRLIQLADIGDGCYLNKSSRFLTHEKAQELRCTFLEPGDILVARMPDPLGRACIFPGDTKRAVTVVDVCIIRADEKKIDGRWLMHMINLPLTRQRISEYVSGTTRQRISRGNLAKIKISVPTLPEQRRIAAILDKADALRAKRREAIAKLDQLLQSVFFEMFGDPATNPKGWPSVCLGDAIEFSTGKLDSNAAEENGAYPFFTCSRTPSRINTYAFDCEALLLAGNNAAGQYWVKHYSGKFNAYQRTYVLRLKNEHCTYLYMKQALQSRLLDLQRMSKGSNTKYLTLSILKPMLIPLAPIEAQRSYCTFYVKLQQLFTDQYRSLEHLDALFQAAQNQAFSGTL